MDTNFFYEMMNLYLESLVQTMCPGPDLVIMFHDSSCPHYKLSGKCLTTSCHHQVFSLSSLPGQGRWLEGICVRISLLGFCSKIYARFLFFNDINNDDGYASGDVDNLFFNPNFSERKSVVLVNNV